MGLGGAIDNDSRYRAWEASRYRLYSPGTRHDTPQRDISTLFPRDIEREF